MADVLEEVQEGLKHKNPQVKAETLRFLVRCLRTTPFAPTKSETQTIGESCKTLLADTVEPVRNAAAEAMGTLMKIIGERAMIQFLDGLDDIRKAKIQEFHEKAEIKARPRPVPNKSSGPAKGRAPFSSASAGPSATAGVKPPGIRPGQAKPAAAPAGQVKRPTSVASVDKEPDSPKKPSIAKPGVKPPTSAAAAASRFTQRQSVAPARTASPPQALTAPPLAPKKIVVEEPPAAAPKLGRGLMGRVYFLMEER